MTEERATADNFVITCGDDGIIRVVGHGYWHDETLRAYFREMRTVISRQRSVNRSVRMLIDMSEGNVQSLATSDRFNASLKAMDNSRDKIAIVATSVLVKLQSERIGRDRKNHKTFQSVLEAEAWLADQTG